MDGPGHPGQPRGDEEADREPAEHVHLHEGEALPVAGLESRAGPGGGGAGPGGGGPARGRHEAQHRGRQLEGTLPGMGRQPER